MTRRIASYAIAASMLLALGACSKSNDTTTTAATNAPATTAAPSDTKSKSDTTEKKDPDTTKKSTGTTSRSTGTTSKSGSGDGLELTDSENQCINEATSDPSIAAKVNSSDPATVAGAKGGVLVACVSKTKIADKLVAGLSQDNSFNDTEKSCLRDQFVSLEKDELATVIGLVIYGSDNGNTTVLAPIASSLNSACGTKIPA